MSDGGCFPGLHYGPRVSPSNNFLNIKFLVILGLYNRMVLYGMVCCLDEKYKKADDLFEMATNTDPTNTIVWTMRGDDNKSMYNLF